MTICSHTGISQPECSCRNCLQAQIEHHMPSLLESAIAASDPGTAEMPAITPLARGGFRSRFRRLRRAA